MLVSNKDLPTDSHRFSPIREEMKSLTGISPVGLRDAKSSDDFRAGDLRRVGELIFLSMLLSAILMHSFVEVG